MATEKIFCGICGYSTDAALFEHLREAHGLSAEDYQKQCPNAPLFTAAFKKFVEKQGVHVEAGVALDGDADGGGALRVTRELFGVSFSCAVKPAAGVPVVDPAYHFDEEQARAVLHSLRENDRILLVGPTGAGKSSLVMQLAARLNWAMVRCNLHGETSAADFLGTHKVKDNEVVYQYGILPAAMKTGQILVLEELDAADPGILFVLQSVLEDGGALTLADNGGEVIQPHPRFRLVATANTLGLGDDGGLYAGTHVLNASHLDRWTTVFHVGYLAEDKETQLVTAKTPTLDHALISGLVGLANAVRKAVVEDQLYTTFSTRRLLALARKIPTLGLARALDVTVLNKLAPNDRAVVTELAQRHLPGLEATGA